MMNKGRNVCALISADEMRLDALVLPEWMQLAHKKPTVVAEYARGFRKHERNILDVFQNQITYHQIN